MLVEPKALVRRLTSVATNLLESAVVRASSEQFYELVVEHLLLEMLEQETGDAAVLLQAAGVDRRAFASRIEQSLAGMKKGSAGRPVISESLFNWMEDAWVVASIETGAERLRSGAMMLQLIAKPARYTGDPLEELEGLPKDQLKKDAERLLAPLPESVEAFPPTRGAAPAAGAAKGKGGELEALEKYSTNFTAKAREGKIDPVFGRDREVRQVIDILARRRKNNPLIVGEPGVGKTALVEGLARAIAAGEVPDSLKTVEVYGLDLGMLQAGAGVRGEFENRLNAVIQAVKTSPKPIILFIDEAHTLIGAGGQAGGSDAANLLKPALARGELRTIAATTWAEYKKYFEKDAALERRFQPVAVDEPSEDAAMTMLRGLLPVYEKAHGVTIREDALEAAVKLSSRYISGRQLPDKAVDLLDTAAARVKIELAARPPALVDAESRLAALEREKANLARDINSMAAADDASLEPIEQEIQALQDRRATLQAQWEKERTAVDRLQKAQDALGAAAADADRTPLKAEVEAARAALREVQGEEPLIHAGVNADAVAQVVATWTGVPVGKMKSNTIGTILNLEGTLNNRVRGQPHALKTVSEIVRMSFAGVRNPDAPVGVMLCVGPSGVGKTETALALAEAIYGGERFMTTINMSEFQEKHTVSRLVGSPPGYVGYGEGGVLTEAVRQRPYSVVLLDECEKADLEVMNLFYQVFDKGTLNDGEGRTINFRNTLILLTSNLASDRVVSMYANGAKPSVEEVVEAIRPVLSNHFKPALLARMTVVPYAPVGPEVLAEIARLKLGSLAKRLETAHGIHTEFNQSLVDELIRRCTESELGGRLVEQTLRASLMPALARELLGRMASGTMPKRLEVGWQPEGAWAFDFSGGASA